MISIVLTQYEGSILGPIARVLGVIMDAIFNLCSTIGIENIGIVHYFIYHCGKCDFAAFDY